MKKVGKQKQTAAQEAGLISRRYEFGLYPTKEQIPVLLEQAARVRTLQNALNAICAARYLRKKQDETAYTPYLLVPEVLDDTSNIDHPKASEMHKWVTVLTQKDARWRAMSTNTAHRVVDTVDLSWKAFFRNIKKNPELAGRPKRKNGADDAWIPYIHLKRAGEIGSSGSGCKLTYLNGKNWQLALKGIDGPIHTRGQMPDQERKYRVTNFFDHIECGRFIDADVKLVSGKWKLSICCYLDRGRRMGDLDTNIEFDLLDGFVRVNGRLTTPKGIVRAQIIQDESDKAQADRDLRWPKRTPSDPDWRDANRKVNRLKSKAARIRKNALHVWSTNIVREASSLTIKSPPIREHTKTGRGDEKSWGAEVKTVAALNRNTLSYAPAMAIQMLKYKAEEADIRCEIIEDKTPKIAIGAEIASVAKTQRRIKRKIKELETQ